MSKREKSDDSVPVSPKLPQERSKSLNSPSKEIKSPSIIRRTRRIKTTPNGGILIAKNRHPKPRRIRGIGPTSAFQKKMWHNKGPMEED